jgi:splicing factor U2AF 65 kDa subunit
MFQNNALKIRRPKDYLGGDPGAGGVPPGGVPDSPNKIFVGGIPSYLGEEQVAELLKTFGELKSFNLVKESATGISKGFAFCEYVDPSVTDLACQGLNGMELGDRFLVVQRASVGKQGSDALPLDLARATSGLSGATGDATRVLQLLNMVAPEELVNDQDFEEILEDIKEELGKVRLGARAFKLG